MRSPKVRDHKLSIMFPDDFAITVFNSWNKKDMTRFRNNLKLTFL